MAAVEFLVVVIVTRRWRTPRTYPYTLRMILPRDLHPFMPRESFSSVPNAEKKSVCYDTTSMLIKDENIRTKH